MSALSFMNEVPSTVEILESNRGHTILDSFLVLTLLLDS